MLLWPCKRKGLQACLPPWISQQRRHPIRKLEALSWTTAVGSWMWPNMWPSRTTCQHGRPASSLLDLHTSLSLAQVRGQWRKLSNLCWTGYLDTMCIGAQWPNGRHQQRMDRAPRPLGPPDNNLLQGHQWLRTRNGRKQWANTHGFCWTSRRFWQPHCRMAEGKVRIMAQDKSKASSGATLQRGFPSTTSSLKPFLADKLLPLLYPLFVCYCVIALGWSGVGKTPALITVILAYPCHGKISHPEAPRRFPKDAVPGWRRAKSLDNFRHQVANVYDKVSFSMIPTVRTFPWRTSNPSWLSRKNKPHPVNDAKLTRNCMRAYASNDLDHEDEPADDSRTSISSEEFMKMTRRLFAGDKLNSGSPTKIQQPEPLHSKYKLGIVEYSPQWETETQEDVRAISAGMEQFAAGRPEAYIKHANEEIEALLYAALPPICLSDKQGESSSDELPFPPPPPITSRPNPALRCNRLGQFRYPPAKRHRSKSKQQEASGVHPESKPGELEAMAQDAEMAAPEAAQSPPYPEGDDLEADAEAAAFTHGWAVDRVISSRALLSWKHSMSLIAMKYNMHYMTRGAVWRKKCPYHSALTLTARSLSAALPPCWTLWC